LIAVVEMLNARGVLARAKGGWKGRPTTNSQHCARSVGRRSSVNAFFRRGQSVSWRNSQASPVVLSPATGAPFVRWSDSSVAPSCKQQVASEASCMHAFPALGDPADARLYPCAIRHLRGSTGHRPRRLPVPGLWTCGRVLRTGPSPAGRVGKSWPISLLTTTCPHSQASRPQGPQAPNNNSFNSNRKRIYAGVCISWVRFPEHKWVRFPERRGF